MARLNYHRLGDSLLAGAMPFRADHVDALHAEGVTAVVNLCQEREYWDGERELILDAYASHGITELHRDTNEGPQTGTTQSRGYRCCLSRAAR